MPIVQPLPSHHPTTYSRKTQYGIAPLVFFLNGMVWPCSQETGADLDHSGFRNFTLWSIAKVKQTYGIISISDSLLPTLLRVILRMTATSPSPLPLHSINPRTPSAWPHAPSSCLTGCTPIAPRYVHIISASDPTSLL